jgi:hypothetical protein
MAMIAATTLFPAGKAIRFILLTRFFYIDGPVKALLDMQS